MKDIMGVFGKRKISGMMAVCAVLVIAALVAAAVPAVMEANKTTETFRICLPESEESNSKRYTSAENIFYLGYAPSDYVTLTGGSVQLQKKRNRLSEEEKEAVIDDFLEENEIEKLTETVAADYGYASIEDMEEGIYSKQLEILNQMYTETDNRQTVVDTLKEEAEFSGYPDVLYEIISQRLECLYQRNYNASLMEILGSEKEVESHVESYVYYELLYEALAESYGIAVTRDEVDEYKSRSVSGGEYDSEADICHDYTEEYTDIVIAQNILSEKVRDYLMDYCIEKI